MLDIFEDELTVVSNTEKSLIMSISISCPGRGYRPAIGSSGEKET